MKVSSEKQFSLVILKPDFLSIQYLKEKLRSALTESGLEIVEYGNIRMDLEFIRQLYQWAVLHFPVELEDYLCKQPLPVWLIRGENAISKTLAIKVELRKKYSTSKLHTLIHCPNTAEDFERECKLILTKIKKEGKSMKTNNQVEVIVFKKEQNGKLSFLILKRNPQKGGFWQPITGNVEKGETFEEAAVRELREETGIIKAKRIFDTGYSFGFFDDNRQQLEKVFGAEVDTATKVILSAEHSAFKWVNEDDALNRYLKYPGNKEGIRRLAEQLRKEQMSE